MSPHTCDTTPWTSHLTLSELWASLSQWLMGVHVQEGKRTQPSFGQYLWPAASPNPPNPSGSAGLLIVKVMTSNRISGLRTDTLFGGAQPHVLNGSTAPAESHHLGSGGLRPRMLRFPSRAFCRMNCGPQQGETCCAAAHPHTRRSTRGQHSLLCSPSLEP